MWTKLCGIRDLASARSAIAAAPDAVGLNFYAHTPRRVEPAVARRIVELLPPDVLPVGVFVNHSVARIAAVCEETGIRTVQLHGDEPSSMPAELHAARPGLQIIRAFRVGMDGLQAVGEALAELAQSGAPLFACLIDASVPGTYGGSGRQAPWELLRREYRFDVWPPLVLAGGLTPENVAEAVRIVRPWGVDVAGGVESSPGVKDPEAMKRFVQSARRGSAMTDEG